MDQVTASVEMIHEGQFRVLTTRYLSECGCEWVVDMWGNVRRVKVCPRDTNDIRWEDQLNLGLLEGADLDSMTLGKAMARASVRSAPGPVDEAVEAADEEPKWNPQTGWSGV